MWCNASSVPAPSLWAIPKDFEADRAQRSKLAPDLPTVAEAVLPGFHFVGWVGVFMLLSSLTGLWLWWPLNGRVSRGLRWKRKPETSANLHHAGGFWIAIPLAVLVGVLAGTSIAGIVGALVGGFLLGLITNEDWTTGINIGTLVAAIIGAIIVVFVWNMITKRRGSTTV